jgi:hypothetical protein
MAQDRMEDLYHSTYEADEEQAIALEEEQYKRELLEEEWQNAIQAIEQEAQ